MKPFKYTSVTSIRTASQRLAGNPDAKVIGGGTNLLDLMKEYVEQLGELIDVSGIRQGGIRQIPAGKNKGGLSLGAMEKNADTANHPLVRWHYPLLSKAILAGASAQIRNMATNGGNLVQRTRCPYFYEVSMPCNKRKPGSGCGALQGFNRMHAIFGWSEHCVAVFPSDMSVALAALEAEIHTRNATGTERIIPIADFHRLPGDSPQKDTVLLHDELITSIELPPGDFAARSCYLKVRDRASYAFALVSVAAALELEGRRIVKARIALGGVAHKPWRALEAERLLEGKEAVGETFESAASAEMSGAKPLEHNKFKVDLGKRAIVLALTQALKGT